jgi:hypothetical protein
MTQQPTQPALFFAGALLKEYGLTRNLVYPHIKSGTLPAYNMGTPKKPYYMIRLEDWEQWLESLKVGKK